MSEIQNNNDQPASGKQPANETVVDRLVFSALREQTRARRWRIGFVLFFFVYLTVTTTMIFVKSDSGFMVGGEPDGAKHTAVVKLSGIISSGEEGGSKQLSPASRPLSSMKTAPLSFSKLTRPGVLRCRRPTFITRSSACGKSTHRYPCMRWLSISPPPVAILSPPPRTRFT